MITYYTNMSEDDVYSESEMLESVDIYDSISQIWSFSDYRKSHEEKNTPLYGEYMEWLKEKEDEHEDLVCLETKDGSEMYFFMPADPSVKLWLEENDRIVRSSWT